MARTSPPPSHFFIYSSRFLRACALASCLTVYPFGGPAQAGSQDLLGPAIDEAMFREGEIAHNKKSFNAWTSVCDEMIRVHRRFCSLRAALTSATGNLVGELLISTGDDGRPAALLRMPLGVWVGGGAQFWIEILGDDKTGPKPSKTPTRALPLVACDMRYCIGVWSLAPQEVQALNRNSTVHIRYQRLDPIHPLITPMRRSEFLQFVDGTASAKGFSEAVNASLQ